MTGMDFGIGKDFGLGMKGDIMELEEQDSSPYGLDEYNYSHEIDFGYYDEPKPVDNKRDNNNYGYSTYVEDDYTPEIHYDEPVETYYEEPVVHYEEPVVHYDDSEPESEDSESEEEEQSGWGAMLGRWAAKRRSSGSGSGSRWGSGNKSSGSNWGNKSKGKGTGRWGGRRW